MEIRTTRLVIRDFTDADTDAALDLLTDKNIKKTYMLPDFGKREDALHLFRRLMALSVDTSHFVRGIYLENRLIGILNDVDIRDKSIELGYVIAQSHQGQGYMTEALRSVIDHLFSQGFKQVTAGAFETNHASLRVMVKAGMTPTGKTEQLEYRGKTHRCLYYSIDNRKPTLKFPCLVLDHDDTVVRSEETVNYPYFVYILDQFRPGTTLTLAEYVQGCSDLGFAEMCRRWYGFTEEELVEEYQGWQEYIKTHMPAPFPGIERIIRRQKEAGGRICVVSHSCNDNITRDYAAHFGILPDDIYGWDYPEAQRKPNPWPLKRIMEKYNLSPTQLLVVDDMKPAWEMARGAGVPIAFAAWGRQEYPQIMTEMTGLCDFAFHTTRELEVFLFEEESL